ncbi:MAG: DUF6537 domain-containing protein, partial [Ramlibacter sp.]
MAGLAQKGGSVWSHLRFGASPEAIKTIRIAAGGADLILGCDMIVAGNSKTLAAARSGTRVLVNTREAMPGEFTRNADMRFPRDGLRKNMTDTVGEDNAEFVDAGRIATALMGDSIAANMFMLGFAYQRGLIPIGSEFIEAAIALNGVAQKMNSDAFLWGRRTAVDPQGVEKFMASQRAIPNAGVSPAPMESLDESIAWRMRFLVDYQNPGYAQRYRALVDRVRAVEAQQGAHGTPMTEAVAKYYFKLLAIKDEYEVARLHVHSGFLGSVAQQFEGDYKLVFNLAPPIFSQRDPSTGEPKKREFGPWVVPVLRGLAALRFVRGTVFDVFGYTTERRAEKMAIKQYEANIEAALLMLETSGPQPQNDLLVELASLPELVRGYGHVRARGMAQSKAREAELLAALPRGSNPV